MEKLKNYSPFIIGFEGCTLDHQLESHLRSINPAGIILFKRNMQSIRQTRQLTRQLIDLLGDIMIAVDHEGGIVNRFPEDCPIPPSPAALNAMGSHETIRRFCRLQAELVAYLGFNMNFVPLVDLALHTENQVIGTRAFSDNPEDVSRYGRICIEEHAKLKIGTCAKHFPTHGRTCDDTHYMVGSVTYESRAQLDQDLIPYRNTIQCDVPAIMTAHLFYPMLDQRFPASLSQPILSDLLKKELGFDGLIISDCVEMDGISRNFDPESIVKNGLNAGVDLFISSFSLKRSPEYQLALKKAFEGINQAHPQLNLERMAKTDRFLSRFRPYPVAAQEFPSLDEAVLLHRETLEKRLCAPIAEKHRRFFLLELANQDEVGINAGHDWSAATGEILAQSTRIVDKSLIYHCDVSHLQTILDHCNQSGITCLLITANGYRKPGYEAFLQILQKAESAVHIALLDPVDLKGSCQNEWATRGYNVCTGKMLAIELDS